MIRKLSLALFFTVFFCAVAYSQEAPAGPLEQGKKCLAAGQTGEAIKEFSRLIDAGPATAWEAYYNRGIARRAQGDVDEAIADLTKTIAINPVFDDAYFYRAIAYRNKGRFSEAVSDLDHFLEVHPGNAEAYCNRANAYAASGQSEAALTDYARAITLNKDYSEAYLNRANVYYSRKEYDKAWDDVHALQASGTAVPPRFLSVLKAASGRES